MRSLQRLPFGLKIVGVLSAICCAQFAAAQSSGSITGTVRDNSQAVVSGARVEVINPSTGTRRTAVSNPDGNYLIAALGAGSYNVTITANGFRKYEAKQVILRIGEKIRLDATLSVGTVTSEVVVEGNAVGQVETQSSEMSGVITGEQITQLQLNGRNFTQLVMLVPGVSNQTQQDEGHVGPTGSVSYAINGGRTEFNNWEIDGGETLDSGSNANLNVYPNVDALAEVRVLTSTYGAQYGRNGAGTIEAVTKSGTNRFHGEGFEFLRNELFNAHNYFDQPGSRKTSYNKQDFGYTLGGPIKKNKLFFFWSQEFRRENVPHLFENVYVPTAAERAGDFSDVCPSTNMPFVRAGGNVKKNETLNINCPAYQVDPRPYFSNAYDGFPNNQIPDNLIDHANADPLLKNVPLPNNGHFLDLSLPEPVRWHEEMIKIDDDVNAKLRASFRFIHDSWQQSYVTSPWSPTTVPAIGGKINGPGISMVANLTATISPSLLNEFVFSYGANHLHLFNTGNAWKRPSSMTMTGIFENGFNGTIPSFSLNGPNNFGGLDVDPGFLPWNNSNPTFSFHDNVTKSMGKHNLQFGAYFAAIEKNEDAEEEPNGSLSFSGNPSFSYKTGNSTGNGLADMLVGDIGGFAQPNQNLKYYNRYKVLEPYFQDDWRITKKLTLNLGLRVSLFGSYYEAKGHAYNFVPSAYNPADAPSISPDDGSLIFGPGQSITNMPGMVHCGTGGIHSSCMSGHLFNPAPRIGFAFDPWGNGKMAIRGGYGIFFEHANGNDANTESLQGNPPLILAPVQGNIHGYTNIGGTSNGTPEYFPLGGGTSQLTSITTKTQWPYIQQWHLDIQRELAKNTLVTIAYVGSKGTHLSQQLDLNQLPSTPRSQNPIPAGMPISDDMCNSDQLPDGTPFTGQALENLTVACGFAGALVPPTFPTFSDGTANPDMLRPYQGYTSIYAIIGGANSSYNALQVSGRHHAGGLELTLAYTYSHSIDDSSDRYDSAFVDSYHLTANRASSSFDQRHILTISYIYDLPFFQHLTGLKKTFLGGWQVSGITTIQTGEPFSIINGGNFYDNAGVANNVGSGSYADIVGDPHANIPRSNYLGVQGPLLFNPGAYEFPTGLTFGNSGRNSLNMPRRTNFDMGIFKRFVAKERVTVEFHAEAFNIFNHTQWNGIDNTTCGLDFNAGASDCVFGNKDSGINASTFLHPNGTHNPRIGEFALKIIF